MVDLNSVIKIEVNEKTFGGASTDTSNFESQAIGEVAGNMGAMALTQDKMFGVSTKMLGVLGIIAGSITAIVKSSPLLQNQLKILGKTFGLLLRPIGDFIGRLLRPLTQDLIRWALPAYKGMVKYFEKILPKEGPIRIGDKLVERVQSGSRREEVLKRGGFEQQGIVNEYSGVVTLVKEIGKDVEGVFGETEDTAVFLKKRLEESASDIIGAGQRFKEDTGDASDKSAESSNDASTNMDAVGNSFLDIVNNMREGITSMIELSINYNQPDGSNETKTFNLPMMLLNAAVSAVPALAIPRAVSQGVDALNRSVFKP